MLCLAQGAKRKRAKQQKTKQINKPTNKSMDIATTTTITHCDFSTPTSLGMGQQAQFADMDCIATSTTSVTSSTYPLYTNGFSDGAIINGLFSFLIFIVLTFSIVWFGLIKPHIHRLHKKQPI